MDLEANFRLYDFLIEKGMDGILLSGSIGEFFAVPREEKRLLIREAVSYINRRVTVYVGTNEMEFPACVALSNYCLLYTSTYAYMLVKIVATGVVMVYNFITRKIFIEKKN